MLSWTEVRKIEEGKVLQVMEIKNSVLAMLHCDTKLTSKWTRQSLRLAGIKMAFKSTGLEEIPAWAEQGIPASRGRRGATSKGNWEREEDRRVWSHTSQKEVSQEGDSGQLCQILKRDWVWYRQRKWLWDLTARKSLWSVSDKHHFSEKQRWKIDWRLQDKEKWRQEDREYRQLFHVLL